jgi:hypothetical protein
MIACGWPGLARVGQTIRLLDVSLKLAAGDADINKIPSDQIAFYMLHSGADWGILANGRRRSI